MFDHILKLPITTLFSSQSTNHDMSNSEEDEHVEFDELEFYPEEEDMEDHAIISGKQYKILNSKLNTILQLLNDLSAITPSSVTTDDVEFLFKGEESKMKNLIGTVVSQLETRMIGKMFSYKFEIK